MRTIIEKETEDIIKRIYNDGDINLAILQSLRESNSVSSPRATRIWPFLFRKLKPDQLSINGKPTYAEIAIFTALKCYAIYQQASNKQNSYINSGQENKRGRTLFRCLGKLRNDDVPLQHALDRRVDNVLASPNISVLINGITNLLRILKAHNKNMQIDFAKLGFDLYKFQFDSAKAREVVLIWGQEYFSEYSNEKEEIK